MNSEVNAPDVMLRRLADISNDGVFVFNLAENKFNYINSHVYSILDITSAVDGADISSFLQRIVPEDIDYLHSSFASMIASDSAKKIEFRFDQDDLHTSVHSISCQAYFLSKEKLFVCFLEDISKAKTHEQYLLEFGTKKNAMLDNLVHQMSGALLLMKNLSESAEDGMSTGNYKHVHDILTLISGNTSNSIDMINGLLAEERSEVPQIKSDKTRIDIVEKVYFIHETLQNSFKERRFEFKSTHETCYIITDIVKLLQIVNNFLSNAVKFTPENGAITTTITCTDKEAIICIGDNGIGIPDELQPYVFDKNTTATRTGLAGEHSNGIGLNISRQLADQINGKIWFTSEVNVGSAFYLSIPQVNSETN